MVSLEEGDVQPRYFNEVALRHARDLGEISRCGDKDEVRVCLWTNKHVAIISHHTVVKVMKPLDAGFEDHGSLDGKLQTVSERGTMRFIIYDTLTDRSVQCFIGDNKLAEAIENFRKRVEVYGLIRYRNDGTPISIVVENIVPFPAMADIPDFRSVRGILGVKDGS